MEYKDLRLRKIYLLNNLLIDRAMMNQVNKIHAGSPSNFRIIKTKNKSHLYLKKSFKNLNFNNIGRFNLHLFLVLSCKISLLLHKMIKTYLNMDESFNKFHRIILLDLKSFS